MKKYSTEQIQEMNKKVNHYKWLDKHLNQFWIDVFGKSLNDLFCGGIVSAHGDKGRGYMRKWQESGIPFVHGMALFMLTYTNIMDEEKHKSCEWVINNYEKYSKHLPDIDLDDTEILSMW